MEVLALSITAGQIVVIGCVGRSFWCWGRGVCAPRRALLDGDARARPSPGHLDGQGRLLHAGVAKQGFGLAALAGENQGCGVVQVLDLVGVGERPAEGGAGELFGSALVLGSADPGA